MQKARIFNTRQLFKDWQIQLRSIGKITTFKLIQLKITLIKECFRLYKQKEREEGIRINMMLLTEEVPIVIEERFKTF